MGSSTSGLAMTAKGMPDRDVATQVQRGESGKGWRRKR